MIRIVIAEEQHMLLNALRSLLNLEEDMEVVGQASNGEEAITLVQELNPDVCIMDIDLPGKNGLESAEELVGSECNVILLATFVRKGFVLRALQSNVNGYLLKDSQSEVLVKSIREVMEGNQVYAPELMEEDHTEDLLHSERKMVQNIKPNARTYFSIILDKIKLPTM